jgi:hypothetical protein
MTNKFHLNELILLQSKGQPERNGEYVVIDVKHSPACRNESTGEILKDVYIYKLEGIEDVSWLESALRKVHKGSDFNFTELMSNLNTKIQQPC